MREDTMLDALLCYTIIISTMKHSGYFVVAADVLRRAKAQCRAILAAAMRTWRSGTLAACRAPIMGRQQEDWMQRLGRLETYVASIA
jgi:hypothetical protein